MKKKTPKLHLLQKFPSASSPQQGKGGKERLSMNFNYVDKRRAGGVKVNVKRPNSKSIVAD